MSQLLERRKGANSSLGLFNNTDDGEESSNVQLSVLGEMFDMKKLKRPSTSVVNLPRIKATAAATSKNQKDSSTKIEESLRIACCNNDVSLVQSFLQKSKVNINAIKMCERLENSPLHYSAQLGRIKMCRILLENGADPNSLNRLQQSPLHLAIKEEKLNCAEILIAHGANPYLYDSKGRLPYHYSVHSSAEVKRILIEMELDPKVKNIHLSSLHYMSSVGKVEFVKFLLNRGANPNKINKSGCTALHLAMFNGQLESANILANNGAMVNTLGTVGLTPLDFYLNFVFNSINNLFNNPDYNQRLKMLNINTIDELEKYHLNEIVIKLKAGWKFSNYETVLLLMVRNMDTSAQQQQQQQQQRNTNIEQLNSYLNESRSNELENDKNCATYKQLINYYRKIRLIINMLTIMFETERNMVPNIFLSRSQENQYTVKSSERNSVFWFLTQCITIILNYMKQITRYRLESKSDKNDQEQKNLEKRTRNLFLNFIGKLIKSGEIDDCRGYVSGVCSNWFYKNFSQNVTEEAATTPKAIIRSLCFQYFEDFFNELSIMLSRPSNLADLCRIKIKYHVKNYPNDLDAFNDVLPNFIKRFIRYKE